MLPETMAPESKEIRMSEQTDQLAEIEERLSIAQENLRQLTEQATAYSGAKDEELAAERIKDQEDEIARLTKLRAELTGAAAPRA
jgi:predicted  nucleic acid-binding Zn-ribbon protein